LITGKILTKQQDTAYINDRRGIPEIDRQTIAPRLEAILQPFFKIGKVPLITLAGLIPSESIQTIKVLEQ